MAPNCVKPPPTFAVEHACLVAGYGLIAGVDEVGVGAIVGPLIAAAVVLPLPHHGSGLDHELAWLASLLAEVRDSKQLKREQRERLAALISVAAAPHIGIGVVEVPELGRIGNQARATSVATARALDALPTPPDIVLLDGTTAIDTGELPSVVVGKRWNGTTSVSIAAASIIASVTHHHIMVEYGTLYPTYGFQRHDGNPSPAHVAALAHDGPSPVHHPHHRLVRAARRGTGEEVGGAPSVERGMASSHIS